MRKIYKIWIVGSEGEVAKEIMKLIDSREVNMLSTDYEEVDITDIDSALAYCYLNQPDAIVNCAGLTDFNECEKNPLKAYKINAIGARNLAICSRRIGARMVQVSTSMIFDGNKEDRYTEFDKPNPQSIFAKSKFEGENFVKSMCSKYFIVRPGLLYSSNKGFLKSILDSEKFIASDDINFSPISVEEFAKFVVTLVNTAEYGVYHVPYSNECTEHEFVEEVKKVFKKDISIENGENNLIGQVSNSVLDSIMLNMLDIYNFDSWKEDLLRYAYSCNRK
ncbi:NAD(P)-dependent oxidoreductase [Clostridium sp. BJN0001]|uniref:SDR family oxidoreductase n=1 Tax=Clostridium sp. BJN0001 TaxID=2930219 RepID=UPI001FD02890|nr:NAD(P)-dependent oxidoreductase [Clostridium sp. BJN0001]